MLNNWTIDQTAILITIVYFIPGKHSLNFDNQKLILNIKFGVNLKAYC